MDNKCKVLYLVNKSTSVTIPKRLSLAEVKELFRQEALLFDDEDGVPYSRVSELFGKSALEFAVDFHGPTRTWGQWYINKYNAKYLVWKGFQLAATYQNVNLLKELYG